MKNKWNKGYPLFLIICWGIIFSLGTIWVSDFLLKMEEKAIITPPNLIGSSHSDYSLQQKIAKMVKGQFVSEGEQTLDLEIDENAVNEYVKQFVVSWFKEFTIQFNRDNQADIAFKLQENISFLYTLFPDIKKYEALISLAKNAPIEMTVVFLYQKDNKISVEIKELSIASIKMSKDLLEKQGQTLSDKINQLLSLMEGLKIEEMKIAQEKLYFKGTVPKKIILTLPQENG